MSRSFINAICSEFPGATVSDPWGEGHEAWKVGGKMFACIGSRTPGVSVRTADIETAELLIEAGVAVRAAYLHRTWVSLPFDAPADEMRQRLRASYKLIRSGLTRAAQARLEPFD